MLTDLLYTRTLSGALIVGASTEHLLARLAQEDGLPYINSADWTTRGE